MYRFHVKVLANQNKEVSLCILYKLYLHFHKPFLVAYHLVNEMSSRLHVFTLFLPKSKSLNNDELWCDCTFYRHASLFIDQLLCYTSPMIDRDTLLKSSYIGIRDILRDAMFCECNVLWCNDTQGNWTRSIILSTWKFERLSRQMYSKITTSWYYQFGAGHTELAGFHSNDINLCRCCNSHDETIERLLLECDHLKDTRKTLINACQHLNIQFNIVNLLSKEELRCKVEQFLKVIN